MWKLPKLLPGPSCVANIVAFEAGERFCYYGLRAILTLYFVDVLGLSSNATTSIISAWISATYLSPLLGGFLADSYFGRYSTIVAFGALYLCGCLSLALGAAFAPSESLREVGLFVGLGLVALGTGGVKANVASFGVDQLDGCSDSDTSSFFLSFYWAINAGSLVAYIVMPLARSRSGFALAFSLPLVALGLAAATFLWARKQFAHRPPQGSVLARVWGVCSAAAVGGRTAAATGNEGESLSLLAGRAKSAAAPPALVAMESGPLTNTFLDRARGRGAIADADILDVAAVLRLLPLFVVLPFFWSIYDGVSITWTLQARRLNLLGVEPDQVNILNPLLVLVLVPIFDRVLRTMMGFRATWLHPTPLRRMTVGCFLTALAFALSGLLELGIETAASSGAPKLLVLLQLPQFFCLAVAELCVSTTGLEFFFREAPASMKGVILSLFFLTTSLGDLLNAVLYGAVDGVLTIQQIIWLFTGLMLAAACSFAFVAMRYKPVAD